MNPKYVPDSLTASDRRKQIQSIKQGRRRPKLESFKSKRSRHVRDFESRYGVKVSDFAWIDKHLLTRKGIDKVVAKGKAAYYTSGSRPNQTPTSWALARLASVLLKRGAYKIDESIAKRHGRRKWLNQSS
jgi:hypothetical protein